uniref:Family with sequence similarity 183 member A n=1 Tax=Spermophilus dauricus TaxID=99837 RepID=A0A8C9NXU3_SPEDA
APASIHQSTHLAVTEVECLLLHISPDPFRFLNLIHHAAQRPRKKYPETQTESQEIGWEAEPLVSPERQDHKMNHFRVYKDITLYKAKLRLLGEEDHRK